ncbi:MAG: cupin domain-containing protein [Myxococcales bacterium]|nr:cupin domain-containing protein [Polyangiaceae bacterium]MDW8250055.1 cupin domain-containing protein [Myxococcales bacterium]
MSHQDENLDNLWEGLGVLIMPPVHIPSRPRANLMAHLTGEAPFVGFALRLARLFQIDEEEAAHLLGKLGMQPSWEPFLPVASLLHVTPGPALRRLGVDAGFIRFEGGTTFPEHLHGGEERTLVLQGGFLDLLSGRHLLPGDTLVLPAGSSHRFRIDPGEPCISAVLLLGPISFT